MYMLRLAEGLQSSPARITYDPLKHMQQTFAGYQCYSAAAQLNIMASPRNRASAVHLQQPPSCLHMRVLLTQRPVQLEAGG